MIWKMQERKIVFTCPSEAALATAANNINTNQKIKQNIQTVQLKL
jgi:hypothetical protein